MKNILSGLIVSLVFGLLPFGSVQASLKSKQYAAAKDWCVDYREHTRGNKCFLVNHPGRCPKGYRLGELFKYSKKYGYRTCIHGSKIHNVGKAVDRTAKKGVAGGKKIINKGVSGGKKVVRKGAKVGKKAVKKTGGFIERMGKKIQGWF